MVAHAENAIGSPAALTQVIAHRGASAYAPENTIAAFQRAADMGAHWFELDCRLTADDQVVAIHDDTVDRTTSGSGQVNTMDLVDLKELDAGSWFDPSYATESVPTLGEALDCAGDRIGVYIEIKDIGDDGALNADLFALAHDHNAPLFELQRETLQRIEGSSSANHTLTRKVIAEVCKRDMEKKVVIQSFSPVACATTLFGAPDIRTELLAQSGHRSESQWAWFMHWLELLDPHGFNVHRKDVTQELIEAVHRKGKTIAVWTVNSRAEMRRLMQLGVDAIITNHPDVCLEVMQELK